MDETTPDVIDAGLGLAGEVSAATGLPLRFWAATADVMSRVNGPAASVPVLPLVRYITPPIGWRTGAARRRSSLV
jgi:hypothetical protein